MEGQSAVDVTFIRMLMANQNKFISTKRRDVRALLKIRSKDVVCLINSSKEYLSKIGLELVGVENTSVVDATGAERYFLRRLKSSGDTVDFPLDEFKRLILTFSLVNLEQMSVEVSRLWFFLRKTTLFEDEGEFTDFLKRSGSTGYLLTKRVDDVSFVVLGWRYYCDFGSFDPKGYFRSR